MNYQRIKLNPLQVMSRNNGPHDGVKVKYTGDARKLPPLPAGEKWVVDDPEPKHGKNQRVERELTAEKYGWKVVDLTSEEIEARMPAHVKINGVRWKTDAESQAAFSSLTLLIDKVGMNDSDMIIIKDAEGQKNGMSVAQFQADVITYGLACYSAFNAE
jgi:hypothetical protein